MEQKQSSVEVTVQTAKELGILPEEFDQIKEILGRTPNFTELSVYSVMWSEHCSYKNSIKWLKTLPKDGPHMLVKAGEENAGLVDIGDGLACAFKIESHNHPSALEPYQGAATGVGGINRDIFTMGARPIAQLNSLRFGNIDLDRTKWLVNGVVKGIGDYGNSFGIPIVGGEVYFDDCYTQNPLVNAFSAGIMKVGEMISAKAEGVGNAVYIVGSRTGKDGVAGAAFASKDITEESAEDLPAVQVGDPFQEKLLREATLELSKTDAIAGMQDMGAAGITCSTCEMSAAGGVGMRIDLSKVPTRQEGMKDWEILLSESQERMLVVVKKGQEEVVERIFDKWDLIAENIGEVTEGPFIEYYMDGELKAQVPADSLVLGGGAPQYDRDYKEPAYYQEYKQFSLDNLEEKTDYAGAFKRLMAHPNIASRKYIYEQYDSMVGTINMGTNKPSDAAVVNIKGTDKAIAMSVDCNSRFVNADPEQGTAIAVAEAARNIVCSGGVPSAVTNCLNFGNPYNPEVYWQFVGAIKGMGAACEKFQTPVTGGNVSFYNQTQTGDKIEPVFPTPTIGMIGIVEDKDDVMDIAFKQKGDLVYLIGKSHNDLNSSQYLVSEHGIEASSTPHFSLDEEAQLHDIILGLIKQQVIQSAHDLSEGGLMIACAESAMAGNLGFDITSDAEIRKDAFLFGEAQSRVVVSVKPELEEEFVEMMTMSTVDFSLLGHVTKGEIRVDDEAYATVSEIRDIYNSALEQRLA